MEVREWTYEEFPEYVQEVEGAQVIRSTGDELGVRYLHDVEYARIGDIPLHLQILQPYTRNVPEMVRPCVVFVQGSAWMEQDVYFQLPNIARLALRGYAVSIVRYRHSGIAPFPAQIMDARNAVRFLRKNAAAYHIDPDRMLIAGDSSGGHTAMFAGMTHDEEKENLYPGISAEVKGIIDYYGSISVMAPDSNPTQLLHCLPDSPEGRVMGGVDLLERPDLMRRLSVECNMDDGTQVPPTLILHGTKDRVVNIEQSVTLYRLMKKLGKDVRFCMIKGADHGGTEFWTDEVLDLVEDFIRYCIDR